MQSEQQSWYADSLKFTVASNRNVLTSHWTNKVAFGPVRFEIVWIIKHPWLPNLVQANRQEIFTGAPKSSHRKIVLLFHWAATKNNLGRCFECCGILNDSLLTALQQIHYNRVQYLTNCRKKYYEIRKTDKLLCFPHWFKQWNGIYRQRPLDKTEKWSGV